MLFVVEILVLKPMAARLASNGTLSALPLCLLLICLGAVSGTTDCFADPNSQFKVRHPTPENIPTITDPKFILDTGGDPQHIGLDFLSTLDIADTLYIGVNEGADHEMFSDVRDIEFDSDGRLFILDEQTGTVRIFNPDGSYVGSIGQLGMGPGELKHPESVAILDSGATVIVMTRSSRIHVFIRDDTDIYSYHHSFSTQGHGGGSGCAMNGHIYLLGYNPDVDGIVHKFTLDGQWQTAFGAPYKSRSQFAVSSLSTRGLIACSDGIIAVAKEHIPIMTGYAENGSMLWQVKFDDFKPASVTQRGPGRMSYSLPKNGESFLHTLFAGSDGDFYISFVVARAGNTNPSHLFRINARSGIGIYAGHAGKVVGIRDNYVVQQGIAPYPHFRLLRILE